MIKSAIAEEDMSAKIEEGRTGNMRKVATTAVTGIHVTLEMLKETKTVSAGEDSVNERIGMRMSIDSVTAVIGIHITLEIANDTAIGKMLTVTIGGV